MAVVVASSAELVDLVVAGSRAVVVVSSLLTVVAAVGRSRGAVVNRLLIMLVAVLNSLTFAAVGIRSHSGGPVDITKYRLEGMKYII